MKKEASRILVVEDEPGIAELVQFVLTDAGFSVSIAVDASTASDALNPSLPDLVLLDWMLPDRSGLSLLTGWRAAERTRTLPVIMLTANSMDEEKIRGLNAGADDYMTKPFSSKELIARIRAILRRPAVLDIPALQTHGLIAIDTQRNQVMVANQLIKLDQSEFRLLSFLVAHPGRVFSRVQLLDQVWGDTVCLEERTVDVHVMRLRKSLGAAAGYLKTVRSLGYRLHGQI